LLAVLPYSDAKLILEAHARDRWRTLRGDTQTPKRVVADATAGTVLVFLFDGHDPEPTGAVALTLLQTPHENDLRFVQILCRVFNEDLRTAPDARTHSELWAMLTGTRFSRSIARFSFFSTLPFLNWLRTIENAADFRYEGANFSANIFMTRNRQRIEDAAKNFVPFSTHLRFEDALLHEKWIRSLAGASNVGLVGLAHTGSIIGVVTIPRRKAAGLIAPHGTLSGAISLVRPGTTAFLSPPNGDLYVVLPNGAAFLKTQGRWHYLNYSSFRNLLQQHISKSIVDAVLRIVLDLSFQRKGALLCFLNEAKSISTLVPDHARPDRANRALRMAVTNLNLNRINHQPILLAAASVDGAVVFSRNGRVLDAACMIAEPDPHLLRQSGQPELARFPGARSTAAWNASLFGLSIKISEDGPVTVFKGGRLVGQMA
jgi:hypothetical protein